MLVILLLPIPSILVEPNSQSLYTYAFFIIPFLPWILLKFNSEIFHSYLNAFKTGVLLTVLGILIQIFVDPDLFGLAKHSVYTGDLYGTSSFRPTGFSGSPQNIALILGMGLFFVYSRFWVIDLFAKLLIIFAGAQTLATFFGGALLLFFIFKLRWFAIISCILILFYTWTIDFSNTFFEFLMFQELQTVEDRFDLTFIFQDLTKWLFGNGVGSATQGMLDREFVFLNTYQSESFFLSFLFEFGIIPVIIFFSFYILTLFLRHFNLFKFYFHDIYLRFLLIYFIIVVNMAITPNFSSFRMKFLLLPILLFPLFYSFSNNFLLNRAK